MLVGVPKEIKVHESRVALTPEGVFEFLRAGHKVVVEEGAGTGSAITDNDFLAAGATIEKDVERCENICTLNNNIYLSVIEVLLNLHQH
jgi:alanine dehydrogenase